MKKIAQALTILIGFVGLASSCSTLPEDPRTWETTTSKKKPVYVNPFPTKQTVDDNTTTPHPINGHNPNGEDYTGQI